ncbi:zinc-binding dehydrogenase [Arthrobacter sp. KNU40]|uniref:zinc-binding dehydrogenase n=1 Tax=Arthrobacter sp. KNU40 TaxID=3447965 RepID=UPI003F5EDFE3
MLWSIHDRAQANRNPCGNRFHRGGKNPSLDLVDIISNEKKILGYALHAQSTDATSKDLVAVSKLAAQGRLKPVIDSRYPLEDFECAYTRLSSRHAVGSILLNF